MAGRGHSAITFPTFDLDERDYNMIFGSISSLLLELNRHERVTWSGPHGVGSFGAAQSLADVAPADGA